MSLNFNNSFNNSNFVLQQGPIATTSAPFFSSGSFEIRNDKTLDSVTYNLSPPSSYGTSSFTSVLPLSTAAPSSAPTGNDAGPTSPPNVPLIASLTTLSVVLFLFLVLGLIYFRLFLRRWNTRSTSSLPTASDLTASTTLPGSTPHKELDHENHQARHELPPSRFFAFFSNHRRQSWWFGRNPSSLGSVSGPTCCGSCGNAIGGEKKGARPSELPGKGIVGHELPASPIEGIGGGKEGKRDQGTLTSIKEDENGSTT